jgi:iron complex transport system permease protein
MPAVALRPARLRAGWLAAGALAVLVACAAGLAQGAVSLPPGRILLEVLSHVPGLDIHSGLDGRQGAIVWELRLPRVVLALLVGSMLAGAGTAYQGVFRNPLADPYLLGAAAGAGLGATLAIVGRTQLDIGPVDAVPLAAFVGALGAVGLAYLLAYAGGRTGATGGLLLAGVAVAAFLTALQTYVQQRDSETIQEVYGWLLGRLGTAGWGEVATIAPYAVVTAIVLLLHRRPLDVLAVGDDEAAALGLRVGQTRLVVVAAASLATAAAVAVSGLIGFVGIVVPHTVRLLFGSSYRVVLPLSLLFGGAFLVLADLVARTALAPAEVPIGVVTACIGAPFFAFVLRTRRYAAP